MFILSCETAGAAIETAKTITNDANMRPVLLTLSCMHFIELPPFVSFFTIAPVEAEFRLHPSPAGLYLRHQVQRWRQAWISLANKVFGTSFCWIYYLPSFLHLLNSA
jgi:hypothetical protein